MNLKFTIYLVLFLSGGFTSICSSAENTPKLFPISEFGLNFPQHGSVKGGFIDETGAVVIPPTADIFPPHHSDNTAYFKEGLEAVQVGLKTKWPVLAWGYMDTKGNFAIEPQFSLALPFSEGLAAVRDKKGYGYIDHTGKYIIPPQFEEAHPFSEGLAQVVNSDHLMGFIDHSGKWVIAPQYPVRAQWCDFSEGLSCVGRKVVVQGDPTKPSPSSPEFIWGYIDKTGTQVTDFKFKEAKDFHDGLAAVEDADGSGYIDKTGAYAIPPKFNASWNFSEGLARVETKDGKMGYINKQGDLVFTVPNLQWADEFSEGLANAEMRTGPGKTIWGYIDHTGNFVIKPQFQQARPFVQGLAQAFVNGESGYIDKSGHFVWKQNIGIVMKNFQMPHQ